MPNITSLDNTLLPIIAVETDLADLDYAEVDYNDYILVFLMQENKTIISQEIVLNEVDAKNAIQPVLIVVNNTGGYALPDNVVSGESSGTSEYRFKYVQLPTNAVNNSDVQGQWSASIDNIPHDKVGNFLPINIVIY